MPPPVLLAGAAIGGGLLAKSAQDDALSAAERRQQAAIEEQRRLEEKFGLTPDELDRQERTFDLEERRQEELERRGGLSGEELLRERGDITSGLLDEIAQRQGLTGEELFLEDTGQVGQALTDSVANFDQDIFDKELSLVLDQIRADANRRGVLGAEDLQGNIGFESLGRAGVDLAIKNARERLQQQKDLSQAFLTLSQNVRSEAGNVGTEAGKESSLARSELQKFLNDIQQLDAASKQRAANVALGAGGIAENAQNQAFGITSDVFGQRSGTGLSLLEGGLNAIGAGNFNIGGTQTSSISKQIEDFNKAGGEVDVPFQGGFTGREFLGDDLLFKRAIRR